MTDRTILQTIPEHPFAQYVRILGKGKKGSRSFTEEEAATAMCMILDDEVEDIQLGAFLMLLRVKEETPEELCGFVKAVKQKISAPPIQVDLDWSSYAGKRRHLPWYILSTLLLAQNGHRIFMHGASGHTQHRLYTENVLEELGISFAKNWTDAEQQLANNNFSYMPLRFISEPLAEMINMRHILGLRSPVHSLSRLLNPLNAPNVAQGIFHPPYSGMHQKAGQLLGYEHLAVIKGEGGEIERNPDTDMTVFHARGGELFEDVWPALFSRRHVKAESMTTEHMIKVWRGEVEDEYAHGAITGTSAFALSLLDKDLSQDEALNQANALWNDRNLSFI